MKLTKHQKHNINKYKFIRLKGQKREREIDSNKFLTPYTKQDSQPKISFNCSRETVQKERKFIHPNLK